MSRIESWNLYEITATRLSLSKHPRNVSPELLKEWIVSWRGGISLKPMISASTA
jgi:hypothetical protein